MFINAECSVISDPWRKERLLWSKLLNYTMFLNRGPMVLLVARVDS